jgi:hypothetical protein
VRELDRQRHQLRRLVARVAEHDALIARAAGVHAHRDVARLLADELNDLHAVGIEGFVRIRVSDLANRVARDLLVIDVRARRDLAGEHDLPALHQHLARHAALTIPARCASRIESAMKSQTLSGWPSLTDSELNVYELIGENSARRRRNENGPD